MTRRATALALAVALAATQLGAARPAGLAGDYYLEGVAETESELVMTPDGRFQYYSSKGEADLFADGTWDTAGGDIVLTAKADSKAPPPGFQTLRLHVRGGRLIPPDGRGTYAKAGAG